LALHPEAVTLVQHPADARQLATCAWDASGGVRPDAVVAALLHHREPWDEDAGKLAGRAPDVPELVSRPPSDAVAHQQEARLALDEPALDTQGAAQSEEQSCEAAEAGRQSVGQGAEPLASVQREERPPTAALESVLLAA